MKETYRTSTGFITVKEGTEGSRHDPYSYTEITVKRKGHKTATIHLGLGTWSEVAGKKLKRVPGKTWQEQERYEVRRFEQACGWTYEEVHYAIELAEEHRWQRCVQETGMTPNDIRRAEMIAGWDPNP